MKRMLPFLLILLASFKGYGQPLTLDQLINAVSMPSSKCDHFLNQKGFTVASSESQKDTSVRTYYFHGRKSALDTITRNLVRRTTPNSNYILFETASESEFHEIAEKFRKEGFPRYDFNADESKPVMFQQKDLSIVTAVHSGDEKLYAISIQKRLLPGIKEILYGEDLLAFDSHEHLAYVFGRDHVRKDLYYFSPTEFSRCTVLYPNTDRQAVFIWQDEKNHCGLAYLVIGGQVMLEGNKDFHEQIAENTWELKSSVRAGMNLLELRKLNGNDFSFHSINSKYSGMIVPATSGKIDFQKEGIVLACMNCTEVGGSSKDILSADEALAEGKKFFVFTIMLYPSAFASR